MKKYVYFLIVLVLTVLLAVPAAAATQEHPHSSAGHCVCGGAVDGHNCTTITEWTAISGNVDFGKLESGNYYLSGNVTVKTANIIGTATKISDTEGYRKDATKDLVICLNGYDITTTADRTFKGVVMGSSLTITDCSYDGSTWGGTITGGNSTNGGVLYTYAQSTTNIYGGNFTAKEGTTVSNGGLIAVAQDRGTGADSRSDADQYSTMNIYNGHFYGGKAKNGGNINLMHYCHLNIYGGIIENGTATAYGGNIHIASTATLNIQAENPVTIRGGTAATKNGNMTIYKPVNIDNVMLYNGSPEVAGVVSGTMLQGQYTSVKEAYSKLKTGEHLRMLSNTEEKNTISGNLYLDLAGHDVTGLTVTGTVYGFDSATNGYSDENAGSLTVSGKVSSTYATAAPARRYLSIEENGSYGFHRYYMGVTTSVLVPNRYGMGYKSCFAGSETVKRHLADFGMAVSFDPLTESLDDSVYRIKAAEKFVAGQPFYQKLIVQNILTQDTYQNYDRATGQIYARCFIRLADGRVLFSDQLGSNMLELTEKVDSNWDSYTTAQQTAVSDMLAKFPLSTGGWGTENAHHYDAQIWQPWTGAWKNGGHYYLTADYILRSTITIPAGQSLDICLNGHRFEGVSARMFKVYGTLNIHDHQDGNGDYQGELVSLYASPVMAPVFYIYENGTMNLCGGNVSYGGTAVMTRGGVGMVGSQDGADSNTTEDEAYFNLFSGVIKNGNVQAILASNGAVNGSSNGMGGNLDLVNKAQVNLYRGKVVDGKATYLKSSSNNGQGGNICVTGAEVALNLFDVSITGGSSGVYLRAGKLTLHGGVQITGNKEYNLYIASGKKVTTGVLKNACVGITMGGSGSFTTVADDAYAKCFTDDNKVGITNINGALSLGHGHCVCGGSARGVEDHSCQTVVYTALPAVTDLSKLSSGHYYLTGDVTVSGNSNWTKKQNVSICLNGYDIKTTTTSPFGKIMADAQLSICDCSGHQAADGTWSWDGTVHGGAKNYGGVVNFNANSHGYIYGGNFVGKDGVISGGVFNVCNDGYSEAGGNSQFDGDYNTSFTMYNGYVKGCSVTTQGGSINCWHNVTLNIYGGTVTGGSAGVHGGNISAPTGVMNVKNAVIANGAADDTGGNIYVLGGTTLYMSGATVTDGTATNRGANVYIASGGNVTLADTVITKGTAPMGGGVFNYMATVTVSGDTVIDGNEGYNLHQFLGRAVQVEQLGENARIGIYSEVKGRLLNTENHADHFYSESADYRLVAFNGNTVYMPVGTTLNYSTVSGFNVGYSEVDISPTENGVPLGGYGTSSSRLSTQVDANGRLYVMVTAVTDELGNTVLIVACDQIRFSNTVTDTLRDHMSAVTGVPVQNIYINCSHTHSVPDPATVDDVSLRYRVLMYNGFVNAAVQAMKDRRAATMQIGSFDVTGPDGTGTLNFVRHYQYTDAQGVVHYFGDNFGTAVYNSTTKHVSEADPTMHLIKFTRSGTDVLLTNWRAHPHFTGGSAKTVVSSDYVGPYRTEAERLLGDVEVVFIQGAAGNINEKSRTQLGDNHGLDYIGYGKELAKQLKNNLSCLKTVSTGTIQTKQVKFEGTVDHSTDNRYKDAKVVSDAYWDLDSEERKALLEQYGFSSVYHAGAIIARFNMEQTETIEINVFSIGNQVGFYTVPGELWDSASVLMEQASPFPVTICYGYSLGDYKYFTHGSAWTYESYEGANYRFTVPDTLNKMMDIWEKGLEELYNNA